MLGAGRRAGKVEADDQGRYFTMTGDRVEATPAEVNDGQAMLDRLHGETFGKEASRKPIARKPVYKKSGDIGLTLKRALANEKFRVLYSGDWKSLGFPSQSEAVLSFCSTLASYTQSPDQIDQLFRTSNLFSGEWARGKWDRLGESEIGKALNNVSHVAPDVRKVHP